MNKTVPIIILYFSALTLGVLGVMNATGHYTDDHIGVAGIMLGSFITAFATLAAPK